MAYGSISENETVCQPAHSSPRSSPPTPEKNDAWVSSFTGPSFYCDGPGGVISARRCQLTWSGHSSRLIALRHWTQAIVSSP